MSTIDPIVATITVSVAADVAFEIFVEEVDRWWRPGPYYWNDPARAVGIRFERGVGGRWLELWDPLGDEVFVMGEITGWETGVSLAMTYRTVSLGEHGYPVEISFADDEGRTTITLHHGGWDVLGEEAIVARDRYARGWEAVLGWFQNWANWGSPRRLGPIPRKGYVLQPGEGVDGDTALKASRRSTLGALSITDSVTVGGAPLHQHRYDDEVFYVLEGVTAGDDERGRTARAGGRSGLHSTRGTARLGHRWRSPAVDHHRAGRSGRVPGLPAHLAGGLRRCLAGAR